MELPSNPIPSRSFFQLFDRGVLQRPEAIERNELHQNERTLLSFVPSPTLESSSFETIKCVEEVKVILFESFESKRTDSLSSHSEEEERTHARVDARIRLRLIGEEFLSSFRTRTTFFLLILLFFVVVEKNVVVGRQFFQNFVARRRFGHVVLFRSNAFDFSIGHFSLQSRGNAFVTGTFVGRGDRFGGQILVEFDDLRRGQRHLHLSRISIFVQLKFRFFGNRRIRSKAVR